MTNTCPNCNQPLEKEWVADWHEKGRLYRLYLLCGICSFGYPVDWREDEGD